MSGNPNEVTPVVIGEAWNPPADPDSLDPMASQQTRDPIEPGTNSPDLTGEGWRLAIRRMMAAKGSNG